LDLKRGIGVAQDESTAIFLMHTDVLHELATKIGGQAEDAAMHSRSIFVNQS
jgi:hypothetical protein